MNLQENISRIKQMMGLVNEQEESITDMVKKDQEMRQKETFDTEIDLSNQKQINTGLIGDGFWLAHPLISAVNSPANRLINLFFNLRLQSDVLEFIRNHMS